MSFISQPVGEGSSYLLGYVDNTLRWELLECIHVSSAFSFFGVWPRHSTFIGKCLHLPLVVSASFFAFSPTVCFKTGFQIGCIPSVDYSNATGLLPLEQFS